MVMPGSNEGAVSDRPTFAIVSVGYEGRKGAVDSIEIGGGIGIRWRGQGGAKEEFRNERF